MPPRIDETEQSVRDVMCANMFELAPLSDTFLNTKLRLTDAEISNLSPLRQPVVPKHFVLAIGAAELPAVAAHTSAFHTLRRFSGASRSLVEVPLAQSFQHSR